MEVRGYALIKNAPATCVSPLPADSFAGKVVRVIEFAEDGGVMVVDNEAKGLATFDKVDVRSSFRCSLHEHYVCPPGGSLIDNIAYAMRCITRVGGYNRTVTEMVIAASLARGKFTDGFLWELQPK